LEIEGDYLVEGLVGVVEEHEGAVGFSVRVGFRDVHAHVNAGGAYLLIHALDLKEIKI